LPLIQQGGDALLPPCGPAITVPEPLSSAVQ
jgi:hypothetical protein